jgi:heat shock protein HslJ
MRSIGSGGWLWWLGAAVVLAACTGPRASGGSAPESLIGTAWVLVELNGSPPVAAPNDRTPTLSFAQGVPASGTGGCNQFSGQYTYVQSGGYLRFGPLVSTRRACMDEAANRQETAYLRALESTTRFAISGDHLLLYATDQVVARLRRSGQP